MGHPTPGTRPGPGVSVSVSFLWMTGEWRVESGEWCNGDLRVTGSGETRQWPGHWAPSPPSVVTLTDAYTDTEHGAPA